MKPKRPSEADMLALVQNGFNTQLPKDRAAQAPAQEPGPKAEAKGGAEATPASSVLMARITLTIPEELRYRLKLLLMDYHRYGRERLTQDEYCAMAIADLLDLDEDKARNLLNDSQEALRSRRKPRFSGHGHTSPTPQPIPPGL